ncbi:MAG: low molecular weight phosphatase family protein [Verrucomicrobiota bacterium]
MRVLFVCSGNYYRSRFAEEWFNHLATARQLKARADSRGFRSNQTRHKNPGAISEYVLEEFERRKIEPLAADREPLQLRDDEFDSADRVIALSREEHHPMVENLFPHRMNEVEFWEIEDIHLETPASALARLGEMVERLVVEIGDGNQ